MATPIFSDPAVAAAFKAYPEPVGARLRALRQLIFEVAAATEGVGPIEETLKWGQPAYLTAKSKSGSTIRIGQLKAWPGHYALYVHCQTTLVGDFKALYPDDFRFEGNRALWFDADRPPAPDALRHCIALALTYHRRKQPRIQQASNKHREHYR